MTQPIPQWWRYSIRTRGSRKLGCDDEIDAKDAQMENQALTFFGLDVNKSDVKEGCAPGEWLFHFWTYDFTLHVNTFMYCSQLVQLFIFYHKLMHKTSLCLQGETMQLRNDNLNLVDIEWQDYMKQIQVTVLLYLHSYRSPFAWIIFSISDDQCLWCLTSWQMTLSLLTDRTQLSTIHCTDYGTDCTLHCTRDNGGLPHSSPGQRNLRFILWLNESITRILLRGHTSVPCSWHHAGFCSETDQKRNVIADMTYIHPLLQSKTNCHFQ